MSNDTISEAKALLASIADPCRVCTGDEYKRIARRALDILSASPARAPAPEASGEATRDLLDRLEDLRSEAGTHHTALGQALGDAIDWIQAAASPEAREALIPGGWKLVPIEPTQGMLEAGKCEEGLLRIADGAELSASIYADMIAAAPGAETAPAAQRSANVVFEFVANWMLAHRWKRDGLYFIQQDGSQVIHAGMIDSIIAKVRASLGAPSSEGAGNGD